MFSSFCVSGIREHVQTPLRQKITIKGMLTLLVKNDQLLAIIMITIVQQIGVNFVNGAILYYFKYVLVSEEVYPYFMAAGAIFQLVGFFTFPFLVAKSSRRFVYIAAALITIAGYLTMYFASETGNVSMIMSAVGYCLASLGGAYTAVSTTVMLADAVDYGEYKLGTRSESIVFSMQTMTVKFGNAFAGFLSGLTLTLIGYVPNVIQTESTVLGMRLIMFVAAPAILLIMLLMYMKYYKLNGEFYLNMLSALQVSRDKAAAKRASDRFVRAALDEKCILIEEAETDKTKLLAKMVHKLVEAGKINSDNEQAVLALILSREAQGPTGIADGIAIPHCKTDLIDHSSLVIASLKLPIDFNAPDDRDCDLVMMLVSVNDCNEHLNVIGRLGLILEDSRNQDALRSCSNAYDMVELIANAEKKLL